LLASFEVCPIGGIAVNHLVFRVKFCPQSGVGWRDLTTFVLSSAPRGASPSRIPISYAAVIIAAADEVGGTDAISGRDPELPNPTAKVPPFTEFPPFYSRSHVLFLLLSLLFDPSRLCGVAG
jgi:hypothetical protein